MRNFCLLWNVLQPPFFLLQSRAHEFWNIVDQMSDKFESTLSKSDYLVGHRGRTWEWIFKDFFYISRGEHVKHFVIDAYL